MADPSAPMPCVITIEDDKLPDPWQIPYTWAELEGMEIPFLEGQECEAEEQGWSWVEEGTQFELCGASCEAFTQGDMLVVTVGCPPAGRPVLDAGRPRLPALASADDPPPGHPLSALAIGAPVLDFRQVSR